MYLLKKGLRKILKLVNKYAKHVGEEDFEVDVLLHFCKLFKKQISEAKRNVVLSNIFEIQKKKIEKIVARLHEDLQYDYSVELGDL